MEQDKNLKDLELAGKAVQDMQKRMHADTCITIQTLEDLNESVIAYAASVQSWSVLLLRLTVEMIDKYKPDEPEGLA